MPFTTGSIFHTSTSGRAFRLTRIIGDRAWRGPDVLSTLARLPWQRLATLSGVAMSFGTAACLAPVASSTPTPAAADVTVSQAIAQEQRAGSVLQGTLGVPPFQWNGSDGRFSALAYAMADLLVTDLAQSAQLQLVERARLGDVLKEIDLAGEGRVDSASAPRVGRLLGAQRLILGSLDTLPSGELRLSARIADVETGLIAQTFDARATLNDLLAAQKVIVFRLFDALGVNLTPAERSAVEDAKPAASLAALTAYGRGVQAELEGNTQGAYTQYQRASVLSPTFSTATQRAASLKPLAQAATATGALTAGIRPVGNAVNGTVDRINRPLDLLTSLTRPSGGAGDPAFPSTLITVVVQVRRP